jgi:putative transposase
MARLARVVAPGLPHHVTQRGNRRQDVFFTKADYARYLELLQTHCAKERVAILAYCLMPNHVHVIAVPKSADSLGSAIGETHRRYTRHVNAAQDWQGHLWQDRFASFPMDESHLLMAARYIELNPVRAGLVRAPEKYAWSSIHAHLSGQDDDLVSVKPLLDLAPDWPAFLRQGIDENERLTLRRHERTGRPAGDNKFISRLEKRLRRVLKKQKPGPKSASGK